MCFFSLQGEKSGPEVTLLDLAIVHTSEYFPVSWEASPKRFFVYFLFEAFWHENDPIVWSGWLHHSVDVVIFVVDTLHLSPLSRSEVIEEVYTKLKDSGFEARQARHQRWHSDT